MTCLSFPTKSHFSWRREEDRYALDDKASRSLCNLSWEATTNTALSFLPTNSDHHSLSSLAFSVRSWQSLRENFTPRSCQKSSKWGPITITFSYVLCFFSP
jgi:hypothetical protein